MICSHLYLLKDFLNTTSEQDQKELISFLDPEEAEQIKEIHLLPFNPSKGLDPIEDRLKHIHVSWFIDLLKSYSNEDKALIIKSFDIECQEFLFNYFNILKKEFELKPFAKTFLQQTIYSQLTLSSPELLPKEALPENPLNTLVNLSKNKLEELIDFLSLHDLSAELKSVISSKRLQQLHALLTEAQRDYLIELRNQREILIFKPIGLCYWNGNEPLLKKALHQRGLNRLAKALYDADPSLIWHVCHKLDIGRATIVQTLMKDLKNKKAQSILIEQIAKATKLL